MLISSSSGLHHNLAYRQVQYSNASMNIYRVASTLLKMVSNRISIHPV